MYGFRIKLMTSSKMSTNRVTALEAYIPFIQDYSYVVYSWSRSLHILIRILLLKYNIFMTSMVFAGKQYLKKVININDTGTKRRVCPCVCFTNEMSFNAKGKCKLFRQKFFTHIKIVHLPYFVNFVSSK